VHRTKIIATLGPASQDQSTLEAMLRAGLNVVRLNLAHGRHEEHQARLNAARRAAEALGVRLATIADIAGPEVRTSGLPAGGADIVAGQELAFVPAAAGPAAAPSPVGPAPASPKAILTVRTDHAGLAGDVRPGQRILMDDGNLVLEAVRVEGPVVVARVLAGGHLLDGKKLILPGASLGLPALSEKDRLAIAFAVRAGIDYIAASFVRRGEDVREIKRTIADIGGDQPVIAKIENADGLANLEAILEATDGLMVARGDLGVEIPAEEVPLLQKSMIAKARAAGKPVITATQMLESMVEKPVPTRAEASDVANAILDGTDAVMLSAETAIGRHPVEAVATMARIAERAETALDHQAFLEKTVGGEDTGVTDAISRAVCAVAARLGAAAILTATASGHTARAIARFRPGLPLLAATPHERVARRLTLVWGVQPVIIPPITDTDAMLTAAVDRSLAAGLIKKGDTVVITAGVPVGVPGSTNLLKVQVVGEGAVARR
jgi:pyruvate kinase